MPRTAVLISIVAVLALGSSACGDDGDESSGPTLCGPPVVEQLDPDGGHLIAGATEPSFLTNPPTSGPHTPGLGVEGGVLDEPLSPIAQVTTLEDGLVIVQYRDPADAVDLEPLATADVVVAPAPDLPSRVIATAWARKVTCTGVDVTSLQRFIESNAGLHEGHETSVPSSRPTATVIVPTTTGS